MATRRIPDPKIGGSIPSEVITFFGTSRPSPFAGWDTKKQVLGFEPGAAWWDGLNLSLPKV